MHVLGFCCACPYMGFYHNGYACNYFEASWKSFIENDQEGSSATILHLYRYRNHEAHHGLRILLIPFLNIRTSP